MAITGSGTQADPYLVHSFSEIAEACNHYSVFVELANDIDCNDYGENFEWTTVTLKNGCNFNLNGHTIKNFKVAEGYRAFACEDNTKIHNGKILNVYLSGSAGFVARTSNYGNIENLSISINLGAGLANSDEASVFEYMVINSCAIYIEGTFKPTYYGALFRVLMASNPISNCDIQLNVTASGNSTAIRGMYTSEKCVRQCRIRGKFITNYGVLYCGAHNCVIDLENSYTAVFSQTVQNCTGVINSDKYSGQNYSGLTPVTSAEIINGDALRAKGFEVVNVEG